MSLCKSCHTSSVDFPVCLAMKQDMIYVDDPVNNNGAMCVPIILGTGDIEYHPFYLSIGSIHNLVRRAHHNGVVPIGFLAIPKGMNCFLSTFPLLKVFILCSR
jgi:hypothetical protein